MSSFNYGDPIIYMLRSGQIGDEFPPLSNSYKVINQKVLLQELPVRLNRITISGYFEISGDDGVAPKSNEFVCDYTVGILTFNVSEEGKTVTVNQFGRGNAVIPSSRIWTKEQNGVVTQTLDSIVEAASNFSYLGDYNSSTVYNTYNMIRFQGSFYMYTSLTSAAGNSPTNASYFNKIAGNTNRGVYSTSVTYASGDIIENSVYQKVYQSLVDSNLNNALTDASKWQLLIDISNEVTSANNAATSATNATTAASTATTNANNATTAANTAKINADTATTDANNATTAANTAAANTNTAITNANNVVSSVVHRAAYNASTSYVKNNSVSLNGSTWRCLQNTTGNSPVEGIYWTLEASRGADGAGTVAGISSTNGDIAVGGTPQNPTLTLNSGNGVNQIVKRNASGSIDDIANITPASIGAIPTSQKASANGVATLDGTGQVPVNQLGNLPSVNTATTSALGTVQISASPSSGNPIATTRTVIANDVQITSTSAQTIATYTPSAKSNFMIMVYYRVVTSTTNVTIAVTYTDGTGAQTNTLLNVQSSAVGSYSLIPLFINATASAINVNVTASIANQVYSSSSIVGV